MKIKKIALVGFLAGLVVMAIPVATSFSLLSTYNYNGSQTYSIDGIVFSSREAFESYLNETYGIKTNQISSDNYFISTNGKKIYLGQSQVDQIVDKASQSSEFATIYSSKNDVKYNLIDPSLGELSPKWFSQSQIEPDESIYIYRGNGDATYLDKADALDSFINSGYEVYYFNDIYFKDKQDLYTYLVNVYFKDPSNIGSTSLRIKAPNGEYSKVINMNSKSNWKDEAAAFIQDNAEPVIKIHTNTGYKYISQSENAIADSVNFDDIPYIKVIANEGKQNYVIGLNEGDNYQLSGTNFYEGYSDITRGFTTTTNWRQELVNFVPDYDSTSIDNFNKATTAFMEKFISRGIIDSSSTSTNRVTYNSTLLFSGVNDGQSLTQFATIEDDETLDFTYEDDKGYLVDNKYINSSKRVPIVVDHLSTMSQELLNIYNNYSSYTYIYKEALAASDNYASMKNYNAILKIPLLYSLMMDRLISSGAPNKLIEATRTYFKNIANIITNLVSIVLGDSALQPETRYSAFGSLDFANVFGFNSEIIEFDIEKYEAFFSTVYRSFIASAATYANVTLNSDTGIAPTTKTAAQKTALDITNDLFSLASNVNLSQIYTNTYNSILHQSKTINTIMSNQILWNEASDDPALYTAASMALTNALKTNQKDTVLNSIINHAGELLNNLDSWEYVPNDNVFKKYAYYFYSTTGKISTPGQILATINGLNTDSLFTWIHAINQIDNELLTEENASIANKLMDVSTEFGVGDGKDEYEDFAYEEQATIDNNYYSFNFNDSNIGINIDSDFSGVFMTFSDFLAVTIMRMLADLSQKNTLFILDEETNVVKINPIYANEATKVIIDVRQNNPKLLTEMTILYRGWQEVQSNIDNLALEYPYTNTSDLQLDEATLRSITKNTAQYASIINQNLEYLQTKLTNIGIPLKTGQIIAYSGAYQIDEEVTFNPDIKPEKIPFSSGIVTDVTTFIPKIDKTKSAYVIPQINVQGNQIEDITLNIDPYVFFTRMNDSLDIVEKMNISFEKFLDTSLLDEIGIVRSQNDIEMGSTLIYQKDVKIDEGLSNRYYDNGIQWVKKWNYNSYSIYDSLSETSYGTFNFESQDLFTFATIKPAKYFELIDEDISNDNVDNAEEDLNKEEITFSNTNVNYKNEDCITIIGDQYNLNSLDKDATFKIGFENEKPFIRSYSNNSTTELDSFVFLSYDASYDCYQYNYIVKQDKYFTYHYTNANHGIVDLTSSVERLANNRIESNFSEQNSIFNNIDFSLIQLKNNSSLSKLSNRLSNAGTFKEVNLMHKSTRLFSSKINTCFGISEKSNPEIPDVNKQMKDDSDVASVASTDYKKINEDADQIEVNANKSISRAGTSTVEAIEIQNGNDGTRSYSPDGLQALGNSKTKIVQSFGFNNHFVDKMFLLDKIGNWSRKVSVATMNESFVYLTNSSYINNFSENNFNILKKDLANITDNNEKKNRIKRYLISCGINEQKIDSAIDSNIFDSFNDVNNYNDVDRIFNENKFKVGDDDDIFSTAKTNSQNKVISIKEQNSKYIASSILKINKGESFSLTQKMFESYSSRYTNLIQGNYHNGTSLDININPDEEFKKWSKDYYDRLITGDNESIGAFSKNELSTFTKANTNDALRESAIRMQTSTCFDTSLVTNGIDKKGPARNWQIVAVNDHLNNRYNNINDAIDTIKKDETMGSNIKKNKLAILEVEKKNTIAMIDEFNANLNKKDKKLLEGFNSDDSITKKLQLMEQNEKKNKKVGKIFKKKKDVENSSDRKIDNKTTKKNRAKIEVVKQKNDTDYASSISSSKNKLKKSKTSIYEVFMNSKLRIALDAFEVFGTLTALATTIAMIVKFCTYDDPMPSVYSFKVDNYEWKWSGGSYKNSFTSEIINVKTASDMLMNEPIKLNGTYLRDSFYYEGKLYEDSYNGRKNMLNDYINNLTNSLALGNNSKSRIMYSFNKLSNDFIESSNNLDSQLGLYSSKDKLSDSIINDMENNKEESSYVDFSIKSFTDTYGDSWNSSNDIAAIEAASSSIRNQIRPTIVSVRPELDSENLLINQRSFGTVLPGDSYNSSTNQIETEEFKRENIENFNTKDWFLVDDTANYLNSNQQFTNKDSKDAIETAKKTLKEKTKEIYEENLRSLKTYDTASLAIRSSSFSEVTQKVENDIMPIDVIVYSTSSGTRYFVGTLDDTETKNRRTAFDNLVAFLYSDLGIKLEVQRTEKVIYYEYDGIYFSNINALIEYVK